MADDSASLDERLRSMVYRTTLGLAVGDSAGLAVELRPWIQDRVATGQQTLLDTQAWRLLKEAFTIGDFYVRTYSDDTTLAVLKLEAIASAMRSHSAGVALSERAVTAKLALGIYRWRYFYGKDKKTGQPGLIQSREFQGTGGLTRLITQTDKPVTARRDGETVIDQTKLDAYAKAMQDRAQAYGNGEGSWGNGVVMCLAPVVLAVTYAMHAEHCEAEWFAGMTFSHTHPDARFAEQWMQQTVLEAVVNGKHLAQAALDAYGDTEGRDGRQKAVVEDVSCAMVEYIKCRFGERVCGPAGKQLHELAGAFPPEAHFDPGVEQLRSWRLDRFGYDLSVLARRATSAKFSQHAINSVVMGLYCALHGQAVEDVLELVCLLGGDCDTVGAVAMQFAALRDDITTAEIEAAFAKYVQGDGLRSLAGVPGGTNPARVLHFGQYAGLDVVCHNNSVLGKKIKELASTFDTDNGRTGRLYDYNELKLWNGSAIYLDTKTADGKALLVVSPKGDRSAPSLAPVMPGRTEPLIRLFRWVGSIGGIAEARELGVIEDMARMPESYRKEIHRIYWLARRGVPANKRRADEFKTQKKGKPLYAQVEFVCNCGKGPEGGAPSHGAADAFNTILNELCQNIADEGEVFALQSRALPSVDKFRRAARLAGARLADAMDVPRERTTLLFPTP